MYYHELIHSYLYNGYIYEYKNKYLIRYDIIYTLSFKHAYILLFLLKRYYLNSFEYKNIVPFIEYCNIVQHLYDTSPLW